VTECPLCGACADDAIEQCPNDGTLLELTIPGPPLLDGKYQLERRIGAGGMGVVYRGRHVDLHRAVAVKVMASGAEGFGDRFRIEAAALGRLKHPHIVDVMDFGVEPRRALAYLVMELLEGTTLAARSDTDTVDSAKALSILGAVASAVDFAHERGILHRDLKPANIFLVNSGGGETVKILDFGLAQFFRPGERADPTAVPIVVAPPRQQSATSDATTAIVDTSGGRSDSDTRGELIELQESERGLLMGTQGYMAPELFRLEPPTVSSDLYALGVIAYELLTGVRFPQTRSDIPPPSSRYRTPRELDAPILRLIDPVGARRPASARAAVEAIADADRAARVREWRERERPRRFAAIVALSALAGGSGFFWTFPLVDRLERTTIDARMAAPTPQPPDQRIVLVVLDDRSVDADARPLAMRGDEFGAVLMRVFDTGAKAVAVDLLLPKAWSSSGAFAELATRHADALTLGAMSTDAGTVLGPECLPPIVPSVLGADRAAGLFGFVNLESDTDGVTRHVRLRYRDANGRDQATWAARATATIGAPLTTTSGRDRIDYSVDTGQFARVSWADVARVAAATPEIFRDRLVLVGAEFTGSGDVHQPIPGSHASAQSVSGLEVQALIVNTIVNGFPVREAGFAAAVAATCVTSGVLAFLIMLRRNLAVALMLPTIVAATYVISSVAAFAAHRIIWPLAGPLLSTLLAGGVAIVMRISWGRPPHGGQQSW
jgi:serine/threonine protein kinase